MAEPPEHAANLAQLGARMAEDTPQAAALGFRLVSVEPGLAAMAVPYGKKLVGDPDSGVIAGGVVTTLLDHVCGLAVSSKLLEAGAIGAIATLDLRIDYMRGAEPGCDITAKAHCYKLTHAIAFVRAVAFDLHEDDPVATAQAAFSLQPATAGKAA
ncbi:MAG: PaaI family thioesterase [Caulobacteraceae bacterium]